MKVKRLFLALVLLAMIAAAFGVTSNAFAAGACSTEYTVVRGDTLRIIAARCDTTVYALQRANPSIGSGNLIFPGQVLLLPGAQFATPQGLSGYVVRRGDTVKSIAAFFGLSVDSLLTANPEITDVNLIYEGQRLTVSDIGLIPEPVPGNMPQASGTYVVQRGDTLRIIAAKFDTTVDAILQVNMGIYNPNLIYAGQTINLPAGAAFYFVQYGDTLRIIAARFGTSVDNLLALNPVIYNPNLIFPGQAIRLR